LSARSCGGVNFSGTEFINSSGIALIVGILARARKQSRPVAAYGLSDHYREIFEVTRLADFMGLYQDEQSAIAAKK
jgi:anti-anti-sigma factor